MIDDTSKIILPAAGNIFVDQGQIILKILKKIPPNQNLTLKDLEDLPSSDKVYGFNWIAHNILRFKSFSMLFTMNNPRANPALKEDREPIFHALLNALFTGILRQYDSTLKNLFKCEICGLNHNFNFDNEYRNVLKENSSKYAEKGKEESKFACREFFPLSGTMGSESQSFSNMSFATNICPRCLLIVYYLPFGVQVIEGNLAIFQIPDLILHQRLDSIIVQKYLDKIESLTGDKPIENVGKELKNKNQRIFEMFLDYYKKVLPEIPSRDDVIKNFPDSSISIWLWKFTNSGQKAYLKYEPIPNSSIAFIYLTHCLDLETPFIELLTQETKQIPYTPKQIYNCIRLKTLYAFERVENKKYNVNIKLIFLYYYYILGYSQPKLDKINKIAEKIRLSYSKQEDLLDALKKRSLFIINHAVREMLDTGVISLEDFQNLFSFFPNSSRAKTVRNIIIQVLKLEIKQENLLNFKQTLEDILNESILNEFQNAIEEVQIEKEQFIINSALVLWEYFKSHYEEINLKEKVINLFLKSGDLNWFVIVYAKCALDEKTNFSYPHLQYLLQIVGSWSNLRFILQMILTSWLHNPNEIPSIERKNFEIPLVTQKRAQNKVLDRVLDAYLSYRIKEKGISYILQNFIYPFIQGKISPASFRLFLNDHSQEIDFQESEWDQMIINPETGIEDISYFRRYTSIFFANFIAHPPKATISKIEDQAILTEADQEIEIEDTVIGEESETNQDEETEKEDEFEEIDEEEND